ncbi:unnamed protein product [Parajaminaea phylloscopi]
MGKLSLGEEAASRSSIDAKQAGVKTVEAITQGWSLKWLVFTYASMWTIHLVEAFRRFISANLTAYITSDFQDHSLIPVISIVASVISAAMAMPTARMLDTWDRGNGLVLMTGIALLGLILSAVCTNIYTYCASQVLSSVGLAGMLFAVDIITADTSSLRDQGLAYAVTASPSLISAFAAPKAAEYFEGTNWRWSFGLFSILVPIVSAPLFIILCYHKRKAIAAGRLKQIKSTGTVMQRLRKFVVDFDVLGVVLFSSGLVLLLVPFNLASSAPHEWASNYIIAMLVLGVTLLTGFVLSQKWISPSPFIPFRLLVSRTLLGSSLLLFIYRAAFFSWSSYFPSYLQVVYNASIAQAGYINSIFDAIYPVTLVVVGYIVRRTGRYRWTLYWAVPLYIIGQGLCIYFRRQGTNLGFIVMCQIIIAIGGAVITLTVRVAVLAAANHDEAAASLAIMTVFGSAGASFGDAVSAAVWTHLFPRALLKHLPTESQADWETIYDSLDVQLSYPVGSATRTAIASSYADVQTWMVTAGTAIMALGAVVVFIIRDVKLDRPQSAKAVVL